MAISKTFTAHTELKASDLNELVAQINEYIIDALKNIFFSNGDTLYVTDLRGNIVAQFDSEGLKVTDLRIKNNNALVSILTLLSGKVDKVENKGLSTEDFTTSEKTKLSNLKNIDGIEEDSCTSEFNITDNVGNVIAKVDSEGIHSVNLLIHDGNSIINLLTALNTLNQSTVKTTEQTLTEEQKAQARNNIGVSGVSSISESLDDVFYLTDLSGNIILKVDSNGLKTLKAEIEKYISETPFRIVDANGYISLCVNTDGTTDLVLSQSCINNILSAILNTNEDFDILPPSDLYRVTNMLYHNREYAPVLLAERIQTDNRCVRFKGGSPIWYVANKQYNIFDGNYQDASLAKNIEIDLFHKKSFTFNLHTTKNTVFFEKTLNFMPLGDSITAQANWHTYLRKLLLMDNADWQIANRSESNKYGMQTLGIVRTTKNAEFTYRDKNINVSYNYHEGRPSWAAATYLRHAALYTYASVTYNGVSKSIMHVAWRVLGLYEKYNTEFSDTSEKRDLIRITCNGQYPITIACIDGYVWNNYRDRISLGNVDFDSATTAQKEELLYYLSVTLLDNPDNPFFSKAKVLETKDTDNCYAFDWDTYYTRYKTHDEQGNVLATQGTKATESMHVCVPNVVGICLGTNDGAFATADKMKNREDFYKIAELMQEATNAIVIVFCNGFPNSRYLEDYNIAGQDVANNAATDYQTRNYQLKQLCGSWSQQVTKKIFFAPCFYIQTFGNYYDYPLTELFTEKEIGSVLTYGDVHPSNAATAQWSYQIYSLLAYLVAKNIL